MSFYFVRTPKIVNTFYKEYLWQVTTNKKEVYLTFDDGPTPEVTDYVLDTLKEFGVSATFFCIGKNIEEHPKIFQRIIDEGHSIGNHTYNHLKGWKTKRLTYIENIEEAENTIFKYQKEPIKRLFRPPYGKIKKDQANELIKKGYEIVMWSVLSGDFDEAISSEKCLKNATKNINPGDIIVFHDSKKAYNKLVNVLPKTITHLLSHGFTCKAI